MNCKELTTFLQRVLKNRDLFVDPGENFDDTQALIDEIREIAEHYMPYNLGLRLEISRCLNLSYVGDFYDGWALAIRNGLNVFVNKEGELLKGKDKKVLEFAAGYADRFSEGIAAVIIGGKLRFLKTNGTFIRGNFENKFDKPEEYRFSGGIGMVYLADSMTYPHFINKDGVIINSLEKSLQMTKFTDGYSRFFHFSTTSTVQHNSYGYIKKDGDKLALEDGKQYLENAQEFSEQLAWVQIEVDPKLNKKAWRLIDINGKYKKFLADYLLGRWSDISLNPEEKTPEEFHSGLSQVVVKARGVYFMDQEMHYLIAEDEKTPFGTTSRSYFQTASSFCDDFAVVTRDHTKGYHVLVRKNLGGKYLRDENGRIVTVGLVDLDRRGRPAGFTDGLLKCVPNVKSGEPGSWQYMDTAGRIVKFGGTSSKLLSSNP